MKKQEFTQAISKKIRITCPWKKRFSLKNGAINSTNMDRKRSTRESLWRRPVNMPSNMGTRKLLRSLVSMNKIQGGG